MRRYEVIGAAAGYDAPVRRAQPHLAQPDQHRPDRPESLTDQQVQAAVVSFTLLGDPTRVRMLWALRDRELDVASLAGAAGCRPTAASQHLSKLRLAGLVDATRDGQRMVYRLRGGHVRALLDEALSQAEHQVSGEPVHD